MESVGRRPVVDIALRGGTAIDDSTSWRAKSLSRLRLSELVFHNLTRAAAIGVLVILSGVILALFEGALPALRTFGFEFLTSQTWNPVTEVFGALAPIYGTIVTSIIAMAIAVPFGILIAIF